VRLNLFRTTDYEVTLDDYISRAGVGLSWRKPFDNFSEFIHSNKYNMRKQMEKQQKDSTQIRPKGDTVN